MRIEDFFRFLEGRMPATQGPDGKLRRSVSLEGWSKVKEDAIGLVYRSGGLKPDTRPIPKARALTVVPSVPPEPPEPLGPAEFDQEETHPIIDGNTIHRSLV